MHGCGLSVGVGHVCKNAIIVWLMPVGIVLLSGSVCVAGDCLFCWCLEIRKKRVDVVVRGLLEDHK